MKRGKRPHERRCPSLARNRRIQVSDILEIPEQQRTQILAGKGIWKNNKHGSELSDQAFTILRTRITIKQQDGGWCWQLPVRGLSHLVGSLPEARAGAIRFIWKDWPIERIDVAFLALARLAKYPIVLTGNRQWGSQVRSGKDMRCRIFPPPRGVIPYVRHRPPRETIEQVLLECLVSRSGRDFRSSASIEEFLVRHRVDSLRFWAMVSGGWYQPNSSVDREVHEVLRLAGYEGTLDQLWVSVFGRKKPSGPPQAYGFVGPHITGVTISGQSRKPGSHRS